MSFEIATPEGRQVFHELVAVSDAVYSDLRGDVPAKIGLLYHDVAGVNPRIVCCSLSAYGMDGPRTKGPGYDHMTQGLAGWMDFTSEPDGPLAKTGLSMVDFSGGFVAATALLAGVHSARLDGRGTDCDLSLYDTAISLLNYPAPWHLNGGFIPQRTRHSAHPSLIPFQKFRTVAEWIVVGCAKEKFWQRLIAVLGRPKLADGQRFGDFAPQAEYRDEVFDILEATFFERPAAEWLETLSAADIPCDPANDVAAALQDEQIRARGLIVEIEHHAFGTVTQVGAFDPRQVAVP